MEQPGPQQPREKGRKRTRSTAVTAGLAPHPHRQRRNPIGSAVRRLRCAQGLTQDALAARCAVAGCDIGRGTLAKIEAQIRAVTEVELFTLAQVLRVPMSELFPTDFARQLKNGTWQPFRTTQASKPAR